MLTEVQAAHLVYTEADRLTHYTGGVQLNRPGMQVTSRELRAFLGASGAESRLEKALADGAVEILSTAKDRTRTGTGEHAEYYTAEQKVILRGPQVRHGGEALRQAGAHGFGGHGSHLFRQR